MAKRTDNEIKAIILKVCRAVRKWAIEFNDGSPAGMCSESSFEIEKRLNRFGIKVKAIHGKFRVDTNPNGYAEAHTWVEWRGVPIDVTADQFNRKLHAKNKIRRIIFNSHHDRFLTWEDQRVYK